MANLYIPRCDGQQVKGMSVEPVDEICHWDNQGSARTYTFIFIRLGYINGGVNNYGNIQLQYANSNINSKWGG